MKKSKNQSLLVSNFAQSPNQLPTLLCKRRKISSPQQKKPFFHFFVFSFFHFFAQAHLPSKYPIRTILIKKGPKGPSRRLRPWKARALTGPFSPLILWASTGRVHVGPQSSNDLAVWSYRPSGSVPSRIVGPRHWFAFARQSSPGPNNSGHWRLLYW